MKPIIVVATLLFVSAAHGAAAQGFVSAFVDTTLSSPSATGSSSKPGFGIAIGNVGKIVGAETEVGYQPEVIDSTANALGKSRVITFSGNTLIGPTIGHIKVDRFPAMDTPALRILVEGAVDTPRLLSARMAIA